MPPRTPGSGLLDDALDLLRQADRLHRQFFTLSTPRSGGPCWEPPVDMIEDARGLVVRIALPDVAADDLDVRTDGANLYVRATRPLRAANGATIHRLEIPHGRFERRIGLPPGRYELTDRKLADGCLALMFRRLG
jgi:HSP20 family molecular chaperone IbpA